MSREMRGVASVLVFAFIAGGSAAVCARTPAPKPHATPRVAMVRGMVHVPPPPHAAPVLRAPVVHVQRLPVVVPHPMVAPVEQSKAVGNPSGEAAPAPLAPLPLASPTPNPLHLRHMAILQIIA